MGTRNRIRGFLLKHRVTTLFRRVFLRNRPPSAYRRLDPPRCNRVKHFSDLISWTHRLRTKAKAILSNTKSNNPGRGFIRVRQEPVQEKPAPIPKGHMAVYVGQKDGEFQRIFVPVVFINHPLFGDLLKESENEYGFDHPGGITIPCRISEFERVRTRVKAVQCTRNFLSWKKSNTSFRIA